MLLFIWHFKYLVEALIRKLGTNELPILFSVTTWLRYILFTLHSQVHVFHIVSDHNQLIKLC